MRQEAGPRVDALPILGRAYSFASRFKKTPEVPIVPSAPAPGLDKYSYKAASRLAVKI